MTPENGPQISHSDTTGSNWETNSSISGPTVNANGVEIEVPIEPNGMVQAAIDLGGEVTEFSIDTSDRNN